MNMVCNNKGMSLVEVLVASAISIVIGFIIFTVLGMFSSQSGQSMSSFMMNQQYDNVAHQIARDARHATFVFTDGETPLLHGSEFDSVTSVFMCDAGGFVLAQYKITQGILVEGAQEKNYSAGSGAVKVDTGNSYFIISPGRNTVGLHLSLCSISRNVVQTISPRKDVFICRN